MKRPSIILSSLFCAALAVSYGQKPDPATQPDNTRVNQRDRDPSEATATQQRENPTDQELSKRIRQSIVEDKSLSTYAHNIKIISQNGTVTLKGPVQSVDEKRAIVAKAIAVAGSRDKVTDEMSVK